MRGVKTQRSLSRKGYDLELTVFELPTGNIAINSQIENTRVGLTITPRQAAWLKEIL